MVALLEFLAIVLAGALTLFIVRVTLSGQSQKKSMVDNILLLLMCFTFAALTITESLLGSALEASLVMGGFIRPEGPNAGLGKFGVMFALVSGLILFIAAVLNAIVRDRFSSVEARWKRKIQS